MTRFDDLMSTLDPVMVVVTTAMGEEQAGCLVGFHAQSSIEPGRYAVWLSKANHTARVALQADALAVHFLAHDQRHLAVHFGTVSGDDVDKFAGLEVDLVEGALPLLRECTNRFWGHTSTVLDQGGDHICVVIEPADATCQEGFRSLRLSQVEDLDASHRAEERNRPPTARAID